MSAVGVTAGMVIGELGAGRGRYTMHLARRVGDRGKVYANDIDAEALDFLRYRCQRERLPTSKSSSATSRTPTSRKPVWT